MWGNHRRGPMTSPVGTLNMHVKDQINAVTVNISIVRRVVSLELWCNNACKPMIGKSRLGDAGICRRSTHHSRAGES